MLKAPQNKNDATDHHANNIPSHDVAISFVIFLGNHSPYDSLGWRVVFYAKNS